MKNPTSAASNEENTIVRWTGKLLKYRWFALSATLLLTMIVGFGGSRIVFQNDYRVFFSKDNPQLQSYEALQAIYTKDDSVLIVLHHPEEEVYSQSFIATIAYTTDEAWKLPFSTRVDSLTNFQNTEAFEDDLIVEDLVPNPENLTQADLDKIENVARNEPIIWNRAISEDPNTAAVAVTLLFPGKDMNEADIVAAAARELGDRIETQHLGMQVKLTGTAMLNSAFSQSAMRDMSTLIPLMYLAIIIMLLILLRSMLSTVATVIIIITSTMIAMGTLGWLGMSMNGVTSSIPIMVMTLAVADSVHFLITFIQNLRTGKTRNEAIKESMRINFQPITITSLTTVIGFLSLNFSDSPPYRDLGNIVAVGVTAAWFFSIVLLPVLLSLFPIKARSRIREGEVKETTGFAEWVIRWKTPVLIMTTIVTVGLALFLPMNKLNDQFVQYFSEATEFRQDTDFITEHLTGFYNLDYNLSSGESGGISNPDYLTHLENFAVWMRGQPEVVQVNSLADTMKRLNKNMHGDDESYFRIPDERDLAAQYLLLFEMSLPYGLDLNNQINVDKSATRMTVTLKDQTTQEIRSLIDRADAWLIQNTPETFHSLPSSPITMFVYISKRNVESMVIGTTIAIFIISFVLALVLRSVRMGAFSLIPNLAPMAIGLGIWALFRGQIGMSIAPVLGMTLGIVVDDTVHFLSKYLRARREKGYNAEDAIRYAFATVGRALVVTTLVLTVGFLLLGTSTFQLNSWMGQLTAIIIAAALIFDFLFLPAFLMIFDKKTHTVKTLGGSFAKPGLAGASAIALAAISLLAFTPDVQAETPEEKGLAIAREADLRDAGYGDWSASLYMVLTNRHGQSSTREMRFMSLETEDEGDKRLSVFDSPRDVEGTAFLSYTYKEKDDDQWLYLPALRRVKRIASNNQSGPFVGSEFAYEDLASQEVEKYTYIYLRDEVVDGQDCYLVEFTPVDENSGYTKQLVWIDKEHYRTIKTEFYDRKNELLKTLTMSGYQQYKDKHWRADKFTMVNHQTGKSTELQFNDYVFSQGLEENLFTRNALNRIR